MYYVRKQIKLVIKIKRQYKYEMYLSKAYYLRKEIKEHEYTDNMKRSKKK